jgi:phosphatidylglycerol---prolipoprotein diacylglyceryl transferase
MFASYYIHTLDPVLLPVWGPLAIRWYGLAYLTGFALAWGLLWRWATRKQIPVEPHDVQTLMTAVIIGVMLGGRLGYVLLYDFASFRQDPMTLFRLWEGGMASHGGMLGLALAVYWFAHTRQLSFFRITDVLSCIGPLGIFFGRIANFINGELWGRVTTVSWAVLFPQEAGLDPTEPGIKETVLRYAEQGWIHPRHPSQLYSAALEGLLIFATLMLVRQTAWAQRPGRLTALFLFLYTAARFTVEFFREPEIVHFGWLTQGQLLSLLLLIPAVYIMRAR